MGKKQIKSNLEKKGAVMVLILERYSQDLINNLISLNYIEDSLMNKSHLLKAKWNKY